MTAALNRRDPRVTASVRGNRPNGPVDVSTSSRAAVRTPCGTRPTSPAPARRSRDLEPTRSSKALWGGSCASHVSQVNVGAAMQHFGHGWYRSHVSSQPPTGPPSGPLHGEPCGQ